MIILKFGNLLYVQTNSRRWISAIDDQSGKKHGIKGTTGFRRLSVSFCN